MSILTKCPECTNENVTYLGCDAPDVLGSNDPEHSGFYKCNSCFTRFRGPLPTKHTIAGVGPNAPTTTNAAGARQSDSPYRMDLIPPLSVLDVAAVLKRGAERYGVDNWRGIPVSDHLCHALVHIYAFLSGDTQDNHLGHATTRMMMAHEQSLRPKEPTPDDVITCKCGERYTRKYLDKLRITHCQHCKEYINC